MDSRTGISPSELGVQLLENCLAELLSRFPQLDSALAALSYVPDETVSGIATDGSAIHFQPLWLLRLYRDDPAALRRGYLHMLLHCLYGHPFTGHTDRLWHLAADMAVEQALAPIFPRPPGAAAPFDSHALWHPDPAAGRKWKALASGAGRGGSRAGRTAGNRSETLELSGQNRRDYRRFLRQFTTWREEIVPDPESFDLIFYRFGMDLYGSLPLIEPLEYQETSRLAELVIAVDTSGSCSADTVRQFLEETYAIVSARENFFREMKVYLIQCDCLIQHVTVIHSREEWMKSCESITIQGRGGTDFTPVFRYVEELRQKKELKDLKALLYFTDGDGVYPRERTDYQTAFVFLHKTDHMDHVPPWAVKLVLEDA